MQKALSEPKHQTTFRDNYLAVKKGAAALFISIFIFATACGQAGLHNNPVNQGGATSQGAVYYINPSGLSTGSGSTPATAITLARYLQFNHVEGEKLFFSTGTHQGSVPVLSGTEVGMYGGGSRPQIHPTVSTSTLTWTQSGAVWSATMASRVEGVMLNNVRQKMAQSASYYTITGVSGSVVTSSGATGLGTFAGGVEMRGKEYDFRWFYNFSSAYNSGTGGFTVPYIGGISNGFKFKLFNDHNLIAADGDWAWEAAASKIYWRSPGNVNPNTLNAELVIYSDGIHIANNASSVKIHDLDFYGGQDGIYADSVSGVEIYNCKFKNQTIAGISLMGYCRGIYEHDNRVDSVDGNGVAYYKLHDSRVGIRDSISNIGIGTEIPANRSSTSTVNAGDRYQFPVNKELGFGIYQNIDAFHNMVEDGFIYNTSYMGVYNSSGGTVRNMIIHDYGSRQNDGGGIYMYSDSFNYFAVNGWRNGRDVSTNNNLIYNGFGTNEAGAVEPNFSAAIYYDNGTWSGTISGNTYYNTGTGILIGWEVKNILVTGNLGYSNQVGIQMQDASGLFGGIHTTAITVRKNTIVAITPNQFCVIVKDASTGFNPFTGGDCSDNIFISPYTNNIFGKIVSSTTLTTQTLSAAATAYSVGIGQQDAYSASFVDSTTALANLPLDVNFTPRVRYSVLPLNFHNPMGKNTDPVVPPLGASVYITGVFSGGGGASNWINSSSDAYLSGKAEIGSSTIGSRILNLNDANPYVGWQISNSEKAIMGISSGAGVAIAGSAANDLLIRSNTATNSILLSADNGAAADLTINSSGYVYANARIGAGDRAPTSTGDFYKSAATSQVISQSGLSTGYGYFSAYNNSGNGIQFLAAGSALVTSGLNKSNYGILQFNATDAGLIQAVGTTPQPIIFGINISGGVTSEVGRWSTAGRWLVGSATDNATALTQFTSTAGAQLALHYDASHYAAFTVPSTGDLQITPSSNLLLLNANVKIQGGSFTLPFNTYAVNHTVTATEDIVEFSAAVTCTLPTSTGNAGRIIYIKNKSASNVTLVGMASGEFTLMASLGTFGASCTLYSDGSGNGWRVISEGD